MVTVDFSFFKDAVFVIVIKKNEENCHGREKTPDLILYHQNKEHYCYVKLTLKYTVTGLTVRGFNNYSLDHSVYN